MHASEDVCKPHPRTCFFCSSSCVQLRCAMSIIDVADSFIHQIVRVASVQCGNFTVHEPSTAKMSTAIVINTHKILFEFALNFQI